MKGLLPWPEKDPKCDVDILQILGAGHTGHVLWPCPDVKNERFLNPGDHEVGALADDGLRNSWNSVEDDSTVTSFNVVQGGVGDGSGDGQSEADLTDSGENLSHFIVWKQKILKWLFCFEGTRTEMRTIRVIAHLKEHILNQGDVGGTSCTP